MTGKKVSRLSRDDRNKLWRGGAEQWEEFFSEVTSKVRLTGNKITMCCALPTHADSSASAACNPSEGWYKCLGCGATYTDPALLYSAIKQKNYAASAAELALRFDTKLSKASTEASKLFTLINNVYDAVADAAVQRAAQVFNAPTDPAFAAEAEGHAYLVSRGIGLPELAAYDVGFVPTLKEILNEVRKRQPGLGSDTLRDLLVEFQFPQNSTSSKYQGAIVFPYRPSTGVPGSFKLRLVRDATKPKEYSQYWVSLQGHDERGVFGIKTVPVTKTPGTQQAGVIVEGEFDALAGYQYNTSQGIVDLPFIAASGGAASTIDELVPSSIERPIVLGDFDEGGNKFVRELAKSSPRASEFLLVYDWSPTTFPAKSDPHDVFNDAALAPVLQQHLLSTSAQHVLPLDEWTSRQVETAYAQETQPVSSGRLRAILSPYAEALPETLIESFYTETARALNMPVSKIRSSVRRSVASPEGFAQHFVQVVEKRYRLMYADDSSLYMFDRSTRTARRIRYARRGPCLTDFFRLFGTDYTHVFEILDAHFGGIPRYLRLKEPDNEESDPRPRRDIERDVTEAVYRLISTTLVSRAPEGSDSDMFCQGVHCCGISGSPETMTSDARHVHIINGSSHLWCHLDPNKETVVWRDGDEAPRYRKTVFNYGSDAAWSSYVMTPDDLNNRDITKEEAAEVFEMLARAIQKSWSFSLEPASAAQFLTAAVMTAPLQNLSESALNMHITGPSASGKTSLVSGLFAPNNNIGRWLVEHSQHMSSYTEAGLRRQLRGDSRMLAIDEFEATESQSKSSRRNVVLRTLETFRELNVGFRHTMAIDDSGQFMKAGLITAGIGSFELEQDLNRRVTLQLDPQPAYPPMEIFRAELSDIDAERIRRIGTLFCLQNLLPLYQQYQARVSNMSKWASDSNFRSARGMTMLVAWMDFVGIDPTEMISNVLADDKTRLAVQVRSSADHLVTAILDGVRVDTGQDPPEKYVSVRRILLGGTKFSSLAATLSNYGLAYRKPGPGKKRALFAHIPALARVILAQDSARYYRTEGQIRQAFEQAASARRIEATPTDAADLAAFNSIHLSEEDIKAANAYIINI